MVDGLWVVQFNGPAGNGAGVVVLRDGRVLGGDNGFTYVGSYELHGDSLKARVSITNFDPAISNVIGIIGNFDLLIEGKVQGDLVSGTGALVNAPGARIVVRLRRASEL